MTPGTETPELGATRILAWAAATFPGQVALAWGPSGMVLLDLIARHGHEVPVYFLDTDLLFPETYALIERVRQRYGIEPRAVQARLSLDAQAAQFGERLWERDPDRCCALRKVEPQREFLAGYRAWITGIRRDQTRARSPLPFIEEDRGVPGLTLSEPAGRLDRSRRLALRDRERGALRRVARSRLSQHRLRPVHAWRRTGRQRARWTLARLCENGVRPARSVRTGAVAITRRSRPDRPGPSVCA
jgi:3'-phosphoadenosine 5'-phosphosulfate sulfotransferase (PAPS reductase)/FAD synthetase